MKRRTNSFPVWAAALVILAVFASCQTRHKGCDAYNKLHDVAGKQGGGSPSGEALQTTSN